jgi:hypothetical protein
MGLISPNAMLAAGIQEMLDGRLPTTREDWQVLMNFFAVNMQPGIAAPGCRLMAAIYDIPITDEEIDEIVLFQQSKLN